MRLRVTFAKTGALRYIGHLDLHQVWERTTRRAGLPLAYTQGFHPGPRLQVACALPLGFAGRGEVVDMWLNRSLEEGESCEEMRMALQAAAPPGLTIVQAEEVEERSPALQTQVEAAEYELRLAEEITDLQAKVDSLLNAVTLPGERRGKAYDLRPLILRLEAAPPGLQMTLAAREGATGRPEEVLRAMGIPLEQARIERTRLIFKNEIE